MTQPTGVMSVTGGKSIPVTGGDDLVTYWTAGDNVICSRKAVIDMMTRRKTDSNDNDVMTGIIIG